MLQTHEIRDKAKVISGTVKFRQAYLQIPAALVDDKIINGLQVMAGALRNHPLQHQVINWMQLNCSAHYLKS
jgi:hypothetical protein